MNAAALPTPRRELARRVAGGLVMTLYWDSYANDTSVEVAQRATGETLAFSVPRERALDGFYHPFAYLPMDGGET